MGAAALSLLALQLVAGGNTYADYGIRLEGREREIADAWGWELEATPRLGLGVSGRDHELGLLYLPRILFQEGGQDAATLHRAQLDGLWRTSRSWTLRASASGSLGINDLLLERNGAGGPGQAVQPVPSVARLQYASAGIALTAEGVPARGVHARFLLGSVNDGGLGATAEARLPRQLGARASAYGETAVGRRDFAAAELRTSIQRVLAGQVDWITSLTGTWRHRLEGAEQALAPEAVAEQRPDARPRSLLDLPEVWLGAGVAVDVQRNEALTRTFPYPTAEAGYRQRFGETLDLSLSVALLPQVDRYGGGVNTRSDATGTLSWRPTRDWALAADATAGFVVGGSRRGQRAGGSSARAAYALAAGWEISAGVRAWWQTEVVAPTAIPAAHYYWAILSLAYSSRSTL